MVIQHFRLFGLPLCVLLCGLVIVRGFNLETRLPVIKQGNNGSYFGYSVAAHQILNENSGSVKENLLLVGAPLDENLQPNTTKSGALWKCPITSALKDCKQVITDGRKESATETYKKDLDVDDLLPPGADEIKEGQWLGVTVRSQGSGGKVLVCAHRYGVKIPHDEAGLGLCYILRENLEFEGVHVKCRGKPGHKEFGVCQSGTSGLIFNDDNAIIGAPGSMNWRGAVFVFSVSDERLSRNSILYMGNGVDLGEEHYHKERIKKDGYMGMSLTAGYFIGDNITVYVAGAPRANEVGQVVLFIKNSDVVGVSSSLSEYLIIGGEQIASNFGYEIIGADVNGDKLPDLIVAAPFYFNTTTGEGGAVYIYLNDPIKHLNNTIPVRITGKFESRFGFSLASLGDLNKDGYEDIAVGAPYEGNGVVYIYLGSKKGLILKPSQVIRAESLRSTVPISTFGYSMSGGVDLDKNTYPDLVIGAYEKDVVVLLRARPIIGFVTYLKSSTNLTNFDPSAKNCVVENKIYSAACFQFETCCKINSADKMFRERNLFINYTIEAETFNGQHKTSRIWFDDYENKSHRITKELNIFNTTMEFCQKHVAFLKETARDIQSPIQIRMSYTLKEKEPRQVDRDLISLDNFPILNQPEADKVFNATFLKDCGSNSVCESKLDLVANFALKPWKEFFREEPHHYQMVLGEDAKVILNVSVVNLKESAYEAKLFLELPEMVDYAKVMSAQNEKKQYICSAQNTLVMCELANPLKENESVNLLLEFDMQKVNESQPWLEFKVFVNTTSKDENEETVSLKLRVKVIANTTISINGQSIPEEVPEFVNIPVKGESAYAYKDEIGSRIAHVYTVQNNGPWRVSNVNVEIEWPFQVANNREQGKWLLYMDERPSVEGSGGTGKCDVASTYVNPLKLKDKSPGELNADEIAITSPLFPGDKTVFTNKSSASSKGQYNRVRRDVEVSDIPETYTGKDGKKYKVFKLNCLLNTAKCFVIRCTLDSVGSKQFLNIVIKSRLWHATLIEDYAHVDLVKIASRAKMHIFQSSVSSKNIFSDEFQVETRASVKLNDRQSSVPVPLYIIIAAIVIGLLLFILLTLLLWKFGFFKRRRPDPTLSGNLEKHKIDEYHDYDF